MFKKKRVILSLVLVLSLIILSGCFYGQPRPQQIEEPQVEKEVCNTPFDCEQIKCESGLSFYPICMGTESGIAYCTKEGMDIESFCLDLSEIECLSDNECNSDQKCAEGKCVEFSFSKGFFEDDPVVEQILDGQDYELKDENMYTEDWKVDVRSFEYKFVNAFRMLGYKRLTFTDEINRDPSTTSLHNFQRDHNLPVSDTLDKDIMQLILNQLEKQEKKDKELVEDLPLIVTFVEAPITEPPKEHVAALYARFYKSLPIAIKHGFNSVDGFRKELIDMGGNFGVMMDPTGERVLSLEEQIDITKYTKKPFKFCSSAYYQQFHQNGGSCESPAQYLFGGPTSDVEIISSFIHEFGHGIGRVPIEVGSPISLHDKFGEISFSGTQLYLDDKNGIQWKRPENNYGEFVSTYAREGPSENLDPETLPYPYYAIHHEDFAESFAAYVLTGNIFRERAKDNIHLQEKYNFLRDNVFDGVEYDTGDVESYHKWIEKNEELPHNPIAYLIEDPNWVWDYEFRHLNN